MAQDPPPQTLAQQAPPAEIAETANDVDSLATEKTSDSSPQTKIPGKGRLPHRDIDPRALDIVSRLQERGFETYLVGGCVRDLLAGVKPKDFDIATSALPQQVRKAISFCVIIGRRFKLVLARRGDQQFEVATFRRQMSNEEVQDAQSAVDTGQEAVVGDNFFGTCEEDAQRRDFTINGLFYDPQRDLIIDHVHGMDDITSRTIRMIGDSETRLKEDPIRTLRAIRLSHKLRFFIAPELRNAIIQTAPSLQQAILPRKREEYLKIMKLEDPIQVFLEMYDLGVLKEILPSFLPLLENEEAFHYFSHLIRQSRFVGFDLNSPVENMSLLLYAYFRSLGNHLPMTEFIAWVQKDESLNMMKDELGVFKSEALHFVSCLEIYPHLEDPEHYKKKGERRKSAFLHNDALPLAYRLFFLDHLLSSKTNLFWFHELRKHGVLK